MNKEPNNKSREAAGNVHQTPDEVCMVNME